MIRKIFVLALLVGVAASAAAQSATDGESKRTFDLPDWFPTISGTIRGKWEYQTEENETRFQVRTARVALDGFVVPIVEYKAEIDLSDEGSIKMLDAYAGLLPFEGFNVRLGQMRVPFSIDAHRSPHKQYFANRSFIAKQVGNVRDVGLYLSYKFKDVPLMLEGGIFNGSGLTDQKDYWTDELNFSAKAQYFFPFGLTLQASVQKIAPEGGATYLYDGGATLQMGRWTIEGEYLHKHYTNDSFTDTDAFDAFVCYDLPLKKAFRKISFLARYDYMDDHSDGSLADDGVSLELTDAQRGRLTGGITLSMAKKMNADIRINYEKYFYDDKSLAKTSERDKIVCELVIHFPNK